MLELKTIKQESWIPLTFGLVCTCGVVFVLLITKSTKDAPDVSLVELTEVKAIFLSEPPALPRKMENTKQSKFRSPLPVVPLELSEFNNKFETLSQPTQLDTPEQILATLEIDPHLEVEMFFENVSPAPLPEEIDATLSQIKTSEKSHYVIGELDGKPRLIYHPQVVFPQSVHQAEEARMVIRVLISPSGNSEFLAILSTSHEDLLPIAKKIGNQSVFTSPLRNRKPVSAILTWPIVIKKK